MGKVDATSDGSGGQRVLHLASDGEGASAAVHGLIAEAKEKKRVEKREKAEAERGIFPLLRRHSVRLCLRISAKQTAQYYSLSPSALPPWPRRR